MHEHRFVLGNERGSYSSLPTINVILTKYQQGGGSTFGIMTSVTMKAYPSPSILSMSFGIETTADNTHAFDMVAYMLGQFPSLVDAGVSGYPIILKASPSILGNYTVYTSGMIGKFMMVNTTNVADMVAVFQPLFNHINSTWPGSFQIGVNITSYPSFYRWYEENYDGSPVGYENVMGSRLLDADALAANVTATKLAFEQFAGGDLTTAYIVSGKGVWNAQPRGGSNAVLPAWRKSIVHASKLQFFISKLPRCQETDQTFFQQRLWHLPL
jgi:hypothetical protein